MTTIGHRKFDKKKDKVVILGEVIRITKSQLGGSFGKDSKHRLVVCLLDGDVIKMRPERTRLDDVTVVRNLTDVYREGLELRALKKRLEKARERKAVIATRRETRRIKRTEKRLFRKEQA